MEADKWLTLPCDLLVDIFRRLETTAVIRCAGACRQWRRAIIDNASCLRPRPDLFLPDLLVGFLDTDRWRLESHLHRRLQYVPASNTAVPLLTPATTGVSVDGRLYTDVLSSHDGFLLLGEDKGRANLCLWSALTGICTVLPVSAFDNDSARCMYCLATGYDVPDDGDEMAVWILAVGWQRNAKDGTTYQIFSSTSTTAAWGLVKLTAMLPEDLAFVFPIPYSAMVWQGTATWFVHPMPGRLSMFSMDLRTERTWTTELPDFGPFPCSRVLAVSEDGQLSLVKMLPFSHQMELWVLVGNGGQWTLRRTIDDVQKLLPICPSTGHMQLSGFCPRSGYLFGTSRDDDRDLLHHFVIRVDGSSPRLIGSVDSSSTFSRLPYEMDWSTYISKMKYF